MIRTHGHSYRFSLDLALRDLAGASKSAKCISQIGESIVVRMRFNSLHASFVFKLRSFEFLFVRRWPRPSPRERLPAGFSVAAASRH
jgi:hypothetical protein